MDRPGNVLPRRLMLLVLGAALAGVPWLAVRTGSPSIAEDPAATPAVSADTSPAQTSAVDAFAQPALFGAKDGPGRLSPTGDPVAPVSAAGFPSQQDVSEEPTDGAEIELRGAVPSPATKGLSITVAPEGRETSEPGSDPQPDDATPKTWMSVTVGSADAFRTQLPGAPADPQHDTRPEPPQHAPPGADPDRVPSQPRVSGNQRPRTLQGPAGSLLLPPEQATRRSEQLERIAREADRQIRRGFELAGRGAYFAARAQFIKALRLVAQGLDTEYQTSMHSRSLAAGLTAIKEAEDFIPAGSRLEADLDVSGIISGHRTPVLRNVETVDLTPLLALKCYFTFAQEQLAASAGREVAGSMGLHALGKLHAALASQQSSHVKAVEPKAMAFYQAALLVYPRNYLAANDLGVLLARWGNYRQARAALEHSLSVRRQSTGWHNLAVVYRQLGQVELARRAYQQSAVARRPETGRRKARQTVRWVDPSSFARTGAEPPPPRQPAPGRLKTTKAAKPDPPRAANRPAPAAIGPLTGWRIPWGLLEKRK